METKFIGDIDIITAKLPQADAIPITLLGEGFENRKLCQP